MLLAERISIIQGDAEFLEERNSLQTEQVFQ
jgi:hypothetical protein